MNKYLTPLLLLAAPLAVIVAIGLSVYGLDGPADDDVRAHKIAGLVGCVYGIYATAIVFLFWLRPRNP